MMDIHPGLMIWTVISFLVLLIVLKKFAWTPILKALDEREARISGNIEQAKLAREEAEKALADYQQQLANAQEEARQIVAKSRTDAEKVREDLLNKSKLEAQAQIDRARKQIEQETQTAINSIRSEIADLAIVAAEKVISRTITTDDHKRLISEGLGESRN